MAQRRQEKVPADDIWYVYLLRCAGGSLYTGITKDLERRCRQHDEGKASRYTRSRRPVAGLPRGPCQPGPGLKREAAIKALPRRGKESLVRLAG